MTKMRDKPRGSAWGRNSAQRGKAALQLAYSANCCENLGQGEQGYSHALARRREGSERQ